MKNLFWVIDDRTKTWNSVAALSLGYKRFYQKFGRMQSISIKSAARRNFSENDILIFGADQVSVWIQISLIAATSKNVSILCHLYGDVVHQLRVWGKFEDLLMKRKFSFIVGALTSREISNCLLKKPAMYLQFQPLIKKVKSNFSIREPGKVSQFYYAGRISYFKNVHVLIDYFIDYWQKGHLVELHIYGKTDNYRYPGFKLRYARGSGSGRKRAACSSMANPSPRSPV